MIKKILKVGGIAFVVALLIGFVLWQRCGISGCPDVGDIAGYVPDEATVLLDKDGNEFGKLYLVERNIVPIDSIPEHIKNAFVAIEDKRFYEHGGVDWKRVPGAALANIKEMGVAEGFSTITMQVARNIFPEQLPAQSQSIWRKIGEMKVAREIEDNYTKDEILALYLNQIYYGEGAWGIQAAAQEYFGKDLGELSINEAAALAAIPKAPSRLNPRGDTTRARERRGYVLDAMAELGTITQQQAAELKTETLNVAEGRTEVSNAAPYFVDTVKDVLEPIFGQSLYTGGFRIHTTLDPSIQEVAEAELERQLKDIEVGRYGFFRGTQYDSSISPDSIVPGDYLQGAMVIMDAYDGSIRALIGGRDFNQFKFNRATEAARPVGSAFKPIVYATALSAGYPLTHILEDKPITFHLDNGRQQWRPRNFGDSYNGRVTMRQALQYSKNIPTIHLSQQVGLQGILRMAQSMDFDGSLPNYPSVVLGTAETSPVDMAQVFGGFATLGDVVEPVVVTRVVGPEGQVVWSSQSARRKALSTPVAYLVTNVLQDVVDEGTATAVRAAGYQGTAAGKTGTTNDGTNAWFVGYTPSHVGSVWIGFDNPKPITSNATGGSLAAPVWGRVFSRTSLATTQEWSMPQGVQQAMVDSNGMIVAENCALPGEEYREEYFLAGRIPQATCPYDQFYGTQPPQGYGRNDDDSWWRRMRDRVLGPDRGVDTLRRQVPPTTRPRPDTGRGDLRDRFEVTGAEGRRDSAMPRDTAVRPDSTLILRRGTPPSEPTPRPRTGEGDTLRAPPGFPRRDSVVHPRPDTTPPDTSSSSIPW